MNRALTCFLSEANKNEFGAHILLESIPVDGVGFKDDMSGSIIADSKRSEVLKFDIVEWVLISPVDEFGKLK